MFLSGHDYWEVKPKNFVDPWFKRLLPNVSFIQIALDSSLLNKSESWEILFHKTLTLSLTPQRQCRRM